MRNRSLKSLLLMGFTVVQPWALGQVAVDQTAGIALSPSAPTASYSTNPYQPLSPNHELVLNIGISANGAVNGTNYELVPGSVQVQVNPATCVVSQSDTQVRILNTSADPISIVVNIACRWRPVAGRGSGTPPPEIPGSAIADIALSDSVVVWDYNNTRCKVLPEDPVHDTLEVTAGFQDTAGYRLTRISNREWSEAGSGPAGGWEFAEKGPGAEAGTYLVEIKTDTPSKNRIKADWSDGSAETGQSDDLYFVKLEWITPAGDPVAAPVDAGFSITAVPDGANEFCFNTDMPAGKLGLFFKVKVNPVLPPADVLEREKFTFEPIAIGSSSFDWEPGHEDGKVGEEGDHLVAKAVCTGLPGKNSDFGRRTAKINLEDSNYSETDFEVFFDKDATNHPSELPGSPTGITPNWYHYWAGTAVPGYNHSSGAYSYAPGGSGDYAKYNGSTSQPRYTIHGPASAGHESYSAAGLNIDRKGIDTLAATLAHEKTHLQVDVSWLAGGIWEGLADDDGDELPDTWEQSNAGLGFLWNVKSSFAGFPYGDDEEVYCERAASSVTGDSSQDWARPGKQSANPF